MERFWGRDVVVAVICITLLSERDGPIPLLPPSPISRMQSREPCKLHRSRLLISSRRYSIWLDSIGPKILRCYRLRWRSVVMDVAFISRMTPWASCMLAHLITQVSRSSVARAEQPAHVVTMGVHGIRVAGKTRYRVAP